jgi:hypothetical protein
MSPELVEEFVSHFDRLRRAGQPTNPEAYAFPNSRGGRLSRQRVAEIVRDAAEEASERLRPRGLPPLPHTTPHTLRRTYISIALLANRFDVLWVMGQVGHADSKMTMDVYAHLQQRVKREHGTAFGRLVDEAREQLYGIEPPAPSDPQAGGLGDGIGHERSERANSEPHEPGAEAEKQPHLQEDSGMARPGLEPGDTTIFRQAPALRTEATNCLHIPALVVAGCQVANIAVCRRMGPCWATAAALWPKQRGHVGVSRTPGGDARVPPTTAALRDASGRSVLIGVCR